MALSPDALLKSLNWRYAVKKFDANQKISATDWQALKESLRLSPSSYGLQPWKFIDVQNPELRRLLRAQSWNQSQVEEASRFVVLTFKEKMDPQHIDQFIQATAKQRQISAESLKGFADMMIGDLVTGPRSQVIDSWAQRQTYIAMGFLMLAAALLKIDSCPLEGLDANQYDELLGLKGTGYKTVAAVALGYRHTEDKYQNLTKVRFTEDAVFETR